MPSVLHLIKGDSLPHVLTVIERESREPGTAVTVALLHVGDVPPFPAGVTVLRVSENGPKDALTYSELLDLIFAADRVVTW